MQEQPEAPKTKQPTKPAKPEARAKQPNAAKQPASAKSTSAKPAATPTATPAAKAASTKSESPKSATEPATPSPESIASEKDFSAEAASKNTNEAVEQAKVAESKPEVKPEPKPANDAPAKPDPMVETAAKDSAAKPEPEVDAPSKGEAQDETKAHDEVDSIAEVAEALADAEDAAEEVAETMAEDVEEVLAEAAEEAAAADAESEDSLAQEAEDEPAAEAEPEPESEPEPEPEPEAEPEPEPEPELPQPRRSVAFIGSECYPFVKTGGLGDVMYSLPKALIAQNCDVKVILPNYGCIKQEYKDKMVYRGSFNMDLCSDGRSFYVGIMEYVWDGVVYDFIDNEEFFSYGNPYTNLVDDIPKFCYFDKAALAALNYMNWVPDIIHCHDWQASLVPIYLRTMFDQTPISSAKTILTIHNLRFQGVYNIPTIKYWTNLPDYVFNKDVLQEFWTEANMLKGGLTYSNMITTVSNTYAGEIQTPEYGEGLDAHLRYHSGKLRGIVNGIDYDLWNPATDKYLEAPYDISDVLEKKRQNKLALQKELGLEQDENKMLIGLVSRLTNQKGLDLVNTVLPALIDGNTQVAVLGTGDPDYENSFRYYEDAYRGSVCSSIMYDEGRAHKIYAGADALLVPSRFEPCGLTQLIAMHYGTIPIVRETGGLKDTVQPYNKYNNDGNGFTFDRYEPGLLYDAVNRAKTLYFTNRWCWDEMVQRDMDKDVSWENSARQYRWLYLELTS